MAEVHRLTPRPRRPRQAPEGEPAAGSGPGEAGSEQTRQRILNAATALFYEHGYRGTSLEAIARKVGISAPALYWHFPSKRDICFTAVHEELGHFAYALQPATQEPTPARQLGQFVRTYVLLKLQQNEWLREPGAIGAYRQLRQALTARQQERLDTVQRQIYLVLRGILERGRASGAFLFEDPTATTFAIVTMCEYVFAWVQPGGRLSPPEVADLYQRLVLSMVDCASA